MREMKYKFRQCGNDEIVRHFYLVAKEFLQSDIAHLLNE
jgi:hypothetical protein